MQPAASPSNSRSARYVGLLCAAVVLAIGLVQATVPLPQLVDRFLVDDAFYYYKTALNWTLTGHSTFDGLHATNGYHPLWFLVCALVYTQFPAGGEMPVRILHFVQVLLVAGAGGLLARLAARRFGPGATLAAMALLPLAFLRTALVGLETALLMLMYALILVCFTRLSDASQAALTSARPSPWWQRRTLLVATLGLLSGLLFLSRTDGSLLAALLGLWTLLQPAQTWRRRLAHAAAFAAPLALLAGPYLGLNLMTTGHLMPVSGAVKVFLAHETQTALARTHGPWYAQLDVLRWLLEDRQRWILAGLCLPPLAAVLSIWSRARQPLAWFAACWPFWLAGILNCAFYAFAFGPNLARAAWYYAPQAIWAALAIAGLDACVNNTLLCRRAPGLTALLLTAFVANIIGSQGLVAGGVLLLIAAACLHWTPDRTTRHLPNAIIVAAVAALATLLIAAGPTRAHWLITTAALLGALTALQLRYALTARSLRWAQAGLALLLIVHGADHLRRKAFSGPDSWNYALYQGALWARDNLPAGTTIWADNAGVLGYFSQHPVINTDGLINSYDYLEKVMKPHRVGEYCRQWDYAIDGFVDDSLAREHPAGLFLPLPPQLNGLEFDAGTCRRTLRVFQMRADGVARGEEQRPASSDTSN